MNGRRQNFHLLFSRYSQRELADRLAGVTGNQSAAQDSTCVLVIVNSREALIFAVENGPVDLIQRLRMRDDIIARRVRVPLIVTNVGDFRVGISAPRNDEIGDFAPRKK